MKLYDFKHAPSPRRVRIFLAEKGLTVPMETVDLVKKDQFRPEYRALNPACTVPSLVLDDGTVIGESAAICRYFEELHPEPNLLGRDAKECALIEMWNRWIEFNGYLRAADVLRNTEPRFADRGLPGLEGGVPQIPDLAARGHAALGRLYERLDGELANREFVAGPRYTVADITLLVTVDFASRFGAPVPESRPHLRRWHTAVSARPSAGA